MSQPWSTDPHVEILIDGNWVDITNDVRLDSADSGGGIEITRGVPNEGNTAEPSQVNFTLNNGLSKADTTAGQLSVYSPKNPKSPYYGNLGRNTPVRVHVNPDDEGFDEVRASGLGPDWLIQGPSANFSEGSIGGFAQAYQTDGIALLAAHNTQVHTDATVLGRFQIDSRTTDWEFGVVLRGTLTPQIGTEYSFDVNANGWIANGTSTWARSTAQFRFGTASGLLTVAGSPVDAAAYRDGTDPVTAGGSYRHYAWVRCSAARTVRHQMDWYTSLGAYISTTFVDYALAANTWALKTFDSVAPPTAAGVQVSLHLQGSPPNGTQLFIDSPVLFDRRPGWGFYSVTVKINAGGGGTDKILVQELGDGVGAGFQTDLPFTLTAAVAYNIEGQIVGNHLRGRVYPTANPAPDWQLTRWFNAYDLPNPPMAGYPGFRSSQTSGVLYVGGLYTRQIRGTAEISSLPNRFDLSRSDRWVPVQARGLLRRLGQGRKALKSAVTRHFSSYIANCVMWYQLEEAVGSTLVGSAVPGGVAAQTNLLGNTSVEQLPGLAGGALFDQDGSRLVGKAKKHTGSGVWTLTFFFQYNGNPATEMRIVTVHSTGTGNTWKFSMLNGMSLQLQAVASDGTVLGTVGPILYNNIGGVQIGTWTAMELLVKQNGGNVEGVVNWHLPGTDPFYTTTAVIFAGNAGLFQDVTIGANANHAAAGGIGISQLAAFNFDLPFVTYPFRRAAAAYTGETAGARFQRLTLDENIPSILIGQAADTAVMGPQTPAKILDLLEECAAVDGGVLGESREQLSLFFRTRPTLLNVPPVPLSIDAGHLTAPLEPDTDDKGIRNDVTATSASTGGAAYSIQAKGPLNVNPPELDPDGVGTYDESESYNVGNDNILQAIADFRRGTGTLDKPRYPSMHADLSATAYRNDTKLYVKALGVDVGGTIDLTNPEVVPDPHLQVVDSYTETIDQFDHDLSWVTRPADTLKVGVLGRTTRLDSTHHTTTNAFTSGTSTSLLVTRDSLAASMWVLSAAEPASFPFDVMVSGVRLRVTAITGSSDPQTMTVQATPINGVVKSIPIGSQVRLADPWYLARGDK